MPNYTHTQRDNHEFLSREARIYAEASGLGATR